GLGRVITVQITSASHGISWRHGLEVENPPVPAGHEQIPVRLRPIHESELDPVMVLPLDLSGLSVQAEIVPMAGRDINLATGRERRVTGEVSGQGGAPGF